MKFNRQVLRAVAVISVFSLLFVLCTACGNATPAVDDATTTSEVQVTTVTTTAPEKPTEASRVSKTEPILSTTTTTKTTTTATTTTTSSVSPYADAVWNEDGVLKILSVGNSFSVDNLKYVHEVARAAGVKKVFLGNLFIGGCSLATHLKNAQDDSASYTYYINDNGTRRNVESYKLSDAVASENWDFITFQQASKDSGKAETYDDLDDLMDIVAPLCTNQKVEFVWHMTWAYKKGTSNPYGGQTEMYQAIISAVQSKIVPNKKISKIIPNGTSIQKARAAFGDTLTRDGTHLSLDTGCVVAAMTTVETLVGIDKTTFDFARIEHIYQSRAFFRTALTCAQNAVKNPFK